MAHFTKNIKVDLRLAATSGASNSLQLVQKKSSNWRWGEAFWIVGLDKRGRVKVLLVCLKHNFTSRLVPTCPRNLVMTRQFSSGVIAILPLKEGLNAEVQQNKSAILQPAFSTRYQRWQEGSSKDKLSTALVSPQKLRWYKSITAQVLHWN